MKETGIHAIIQKINADAEQHSGDRFLQRKSGIDKEADSKKSAYAEELQKRREMLKNNNKHEYDLLLDRLNSRFSRELLAYRRGLVDDIFDMAAAKLRDASGEEFSEMFSKAVCGLTGEFVLHIGGLSKGKLDAGIIELAQKENAGLTLTLSPDAIPAKSGFVLKDDRVEYNCLFEDLIEDKKAEQANLILREVFGEERNA